MALRQQHLGAQPTGFQSLSSALPIPKPATFATSDFQYLPAESSVPSVPRHSGPDRIYVSYPEIGSDAELDHDGGSNPEYSSGDAALKSDTFMTCHQRTLFETWVSVHQQARQFLSRCGQTLYSSWWPKSEAFSPHSREDIIDEDGDSSWQYTPSYADITPDAFENDENDVSQIPHYVVDYAPLVHLYSAEKYWPCDMGEHLHHITPELNFTPVQASWQHPQLDNLDGLNRWEYGRHIFLTSDDNVEDHPEWLMGEKNIPATPAPSSSQLATHKIQGGRSDAPAVLVVVNKGHGIVDAFWFYFYSFNLGNTVVWRFGNHVGDWEHCLVRFHHGKPKAVFVSEHFFGQAYTYQAVEKIGRRPVIYSATGSHAMYADIGTHAYILPWGLLHDRTDKGPLWDPALNSHMYTYDLGNDTLRASNFTPKAPTEWFHFAGHWGDKQYPLEDTRQYQFAGAYHYVSGPLGPKFKNLGRRKICQGRESERCEIKNWLGGSRLRRVPRYFDEGALEEEERKGFSGEDMNQ